MRKYFSKVVVTVMAMVMLFSVIAFGAGHCVMYDPRVAELQRRIEEMEEENRLQAERVAELERENEALRLELARSVAIIRLWEHLEGFDENSFSVNNWNRVIAYFEDGLNNLSEVASTDKITSVLAEAKENMDSVPYEDFVLRILDEDITVYCQRDILVNVEFINQTGRTMIVNLRFGIIEHVPPYIDFFARWPEISYYPIIKVIENNQAVYFGSKYQSGEFLPCSGIYVFLCDLSRGVHELSFHLFFSAWCYEDANNFHRPMTRIWSNTILLTVI